MFSQKSNIPLGPGGQKPSSTGLPTSSSSSSAAAKPPQPQQWSKSFKPQPNQNMFLDDVSDWPPKNRPKPPALPIDQLNLPIPD
ncbi:uncharacterized protein L201_007685 [Kwoniella dendrophila CBS 6074]|uniref:Uncharacterized protein n=1 Tax=Kwoniella dendrophila CBS 6074 TaxID=1295534 RepID=A0AAX4K4S5_9TREE